jgi:tRNA-Thr(GGU) m(6)t(6)A37 methyltransferase TsaA
VKSEVIVRFVGVVEEAGEQEGRIRVFSDFCAGLKGIDDFSHVIVLYWAHLRDSEEERKTTLVFPRRHGLNVEKGVFACRSPSRPNPINMCVVELLKVNDCTLTVKGLDAFKGSPIVDVKPYLPRADSVAEARVPPWALQGPPT